MSTASLAQPQELPFPEGVIIIDCRFSLADAGEGSKLYLQGHIPGAHYLDLNRDLSGPVAQHGGRHPLPAPEIFVQKLASLGVGRETQVIAYDDSRLAFAARLWWMMRSLGFRPPRLLDGGYQAWLSSGGVAETNVPAAIACQVEPADSYSGLCDIEGLRVAQERGALLVDSREDRRYRGLEEPIDPVAGHIPGAINHPWQDVTSDSGCVKGVEAQRLQWGNTIESEELLVYCGSGVTACVNLFSLALSGREDAALYGGSWSDWCSYLETG